MFDERLYTELEVLKTDLAATQKQLDGKIKAVIILNDTLEKCKKERNEFKIMAEQVMNRYQLLKKTLAENGQNDGLSDDSFSHLSNKQLASLLVESREANKGLQQEIINLETKLLECHGDICVLRKQLKDQSVEYPNKIQNKISNDDKTVFVAELEELNFQLGELKRELDRCTDEKQEIVMERDIYRNKCDRLNNELNYILRGDERKIVDIDALIVENRFLNERILALEQEKSLAMNTLTKYKKLLGLKSSKNSSTNSDFIVSGANSPNYETKNSSIDGAINHSHELETQSRLCNDILGDKSPSTTQIPAEQINGTLHAKEVDKTNNDLNESKTKNAPTDEPLPTEFQLINSDDIFKKKTNTVIDDQEIFRQNESLDVNLNGNEVTYEKSFCKTELLTINSVVDVS